MLKKLFVVVVSLSLGGCGMIHKSIRYGKLDVQTEMSNTIFLEPSRERSVFLQIRNTSNQRLDNLSGAIASALISKGYKIVDDQRLAHYIIQANVLSVAKVREEEAFVALTGGFGASLGGAAMGSAVGAAMGSHRGLFTGGLVGGIAGSISDAMVEVVTYNMVTDIQVSEKSAVKLEQKSSNSLQQGSSGRIETTATTTSDYQKYQTRIVSRAQQANLVIANALPELEKGLINSIAGLL